VFYVKFFPQLDGSTSSGRDGCTLLFDLDYGVTTLIFTKMHFQLIPSVVFIQKVVFSKLSLSETMKISQASFKLKRSSFMREKIS